MGAACFATLPAGTPSCCDTSHQTVNYLHGNDSGIRRFARVESGFARPVVIDPVLTYSTFIGGSSKSGDTGSALALDATGNIYIVGSTSSVDFPHTVGSVSGGSDAFAMKLNPAGTEVLYSTYLGGSGYEQGVAIAVDANGNAYLTGNTTSPDFPVTNNAFRTVRAGDLDGFVTKLDAAGGVVYSTYLGGSESDSARSIAVGPSGEALVAGFTNSSDFPTTAGVVQPGLRGTTDAFLAKLSPTGGSLMFATYLGGSGTDRAFGIALDEAGNSYVAGSTESSDFPATAGAAQSTLAGLVDAFVAKLSPDGDLLRYATFLGGSGGEEASSVVVDSAGRAHVTGYTNSSDYPTTSGAAQRASAGGLDVFVAKLAASGNGLAYSTYLGGSRSDFGESLTLDSSGNAHLTGGTRSADFPVTAGALASSYTGSDDAFVAQITPGGALAYASYLGGTGEDRGLDIVVNDAGSQVVIGTTSSSNFPVSPDGLQTSARSGVSQAFLVTTGSMSGLTAGLSVAATVSPDPVTIGANATYRLVVTNAGPATATAVSLTDVLPSSIGFVSCSATGGGSCQGSGNNRRVIFPSLAAGASATANIVGTMSASLADGTPVVNIVSVNSGLLDPDRGDNYAVIGTKAVRGETIVTPSKPTGTAAAVAGTVYSYTTLGARSSAGHPVQYRLQWGDGSDSGWLAGGTRTATKSWSTAGTYAVRAEARCATHTSAVSNLSPQLTVKVTYFISGRVMLASGAGIGSVVVSLSGSKTGSTSTNASGYYTFKGLSAGGNYTLKPSKAGYVFTPVNQTFSSLGANQTANFTGTLTYKIGGRITRANGTAISGVTVTLSGSASRTAQSNATGYYSFTALPAGGNYIVTPSKIGFSFTPVEWTFTGLNANKTANFKGALR